MPPTPPESRVRMCERRQAEEDEGNADHAPRRERRGRRKEMDWAARIFRSLKLDVLSCPRCGGRMNVIACLTQPAEIPKFLRSIGLSSEIPSRAPPRDPPQGEFEFAP